MLPAIAEGNAGLRTGAKERQPLIFESEFRPHIFGDQTAVITLTGRMTHPLHINVRPRPFRDNYLQRNLAAPFLRSRRFVTETDFQLALRRNHPVDAQFYLIAICAGNQSGRILLQQSRSHG